MALSIVNYSNAFSNRGKMAIKTRFAAGEVYSYHIPSSASNTAQAVSEQVWDAVLAYSTGYRNGACASIKGGTVAELDASNGARSVVFINAPSLGAKNVQAALVTGSADAPVIQKGYVLADKLNPSGFKGTAILLALMPYILQDEEAQTAYEELRKYAQYADDDPFWDSEQHRDEFGRILATLSCNIYYRSKNDVDYSHDKVVAGSGKCPAQLSLKLALTKQEDIKAFTAKKLKQALSSPKGKFIYVQSVIDITQIGEKYFLNKNMTVQEKARVAKMPPEYKLEEWVVNFAKLICSTTRFPYPIRTVGLFGPAGTGKSVNTKALFSLLGLEHDIITCHADMELMDFIGMLIPKGGEKVLSWKDIMKELGLPNTDDIMNDPAGSYIRLYKKPAPPFLQKKLSGLSSDEQETLRRGQDRMICDMMSKCFNEIEKRSTSGQYEYVEGPLVRACRSGHGIEIQEAGIIKRPGVLVGLNALLESGPTNWITLQTGEVIQKHPNTVIVFTSNDDYIGTTLLNQSVISRLSLVQWFKNPSIETMVERVIRQTGFTNRVLLTKMANVLQQLNACCKDKDINDGSLGQRELLNWAMVVIAQAEEEGISLDEVPNEIVGDACLITVLGKISQVAENIEEVVDSVMNATDFGVRSLRV